MKFKNCTFFVTIIIFGKYLANIYGLHKYLSEFYDCRYNQHLNSVEFCTISLGCVNKSSIAFRLYALFTICRIFFAMANGYDYF